MPANTQTCAGYSGGTYNCPGHSDKRPENLPDLSKYDTGDIVKTPDLNKLRKAIKDEIARRKQHIWYTSGEDLGGNDVSSGEIIYHPQQNEVAQCVNAIDGLINQLNDTALNPGKKQTDLLSVMNGDIISAWNLKAIETALCLVTTDCICYSDCASYCGGNCATYCAGHCGSYCPSYSSCSCNGNCCHYGYWW